MARDILRQVSGIADEHQATRVRSVEIDCGEFSGIEIPLLESALHRLGTASSRLRECAFTIHRKPLFAECEACHSNFAVANFHFQCATCGSREIRLVDGESIRIVSLTVGD